MGGNKYYLYAQLKVQTVKSHRLEVIHVSIFFVVIFRFKDGIQELLVIIKDKNTIDKGYLEMEMNTGQIGGITCGDMDIKE